MTIRGRRFRVTAVLAVVLVMALGTAALAQGVGNTATPVTVGAEDEAAEEAAEVEEQARLAESAGITEDEAVDAALSVVTGEVTGVELEDDNGTLVYEVEIAGTDVSVDATSGDVVGQETDDEDDAEDDGVDHQNEETGENESGSDHED